MVVALPEQKHRWSRILNLFNRDLRRSSFDPDAPRPRRKSGGGGTWRGRRQQQYQGVAGQVGNEATGEVRGGQRQVGEAGEGGEGISNQVAVPGSQQHTSQLDGIFESAVARPGDFQQEASACELLVARGPRRVHRSRM